MSQCNDENKPLKWVWCKIGAKCPKILVRLPVPPWSQQEAIEPLHWGTWGCCVKCHGFVGMFSSSPHSGCRVCAGEQFVLTWAKFTICCRVLLLLLRETVKSKSGHANMLKMGDLCRNLPLSFLHCAPYWSVSGLMNRCLHLSRKPISERVSKLQIRRSLWRPSLLRTGH